MQAGWPEDGHVEPADLALREGDRADRQPVRGERTLEIGGEDLRAAPIGVGDDLDDVALRLLRTGQLGILARGRREPEGRGISHRSRPVRTRDGRVGHAEHPER
jgi:hypothetical protein